MDNIEDDDLTDLSWLNVSNVKQSQLSVECSDNHVNDDLQCLCWVIRIRPSSYLIERPPSESERSNSDNPHDNYNHSLSCIYGSDPSQNHLLTAVTNTAIGVESRNHALVNSTSERMLMVRTLNKQQSFILIRSSNDKISCLPLRSKLTNHFV